MVVLYMRGVEYSQIGEAHLTNRTNTIVYPTSSPQNRPTDKVLLRASNTRGTMNTKTSLNKRKHEAGFTLIELLIVMSVMLILMTLAVPELLHLRKQATSPQPSPPSAPSPSPSSTTTRTTAPSPAPSPPSAETPRRGPQRHRRPDHPLRPDHRPEGWLYLRHHQLRQDHHQ